MKIIGKFQQTSLLLILPLFLNSLTHKHLRQSSITLDVRLGKKVFVLNVQIIITLTKMEFAAKLSLNAEFLTKHREFVNHAIKAIK